MGKPLLPDLRSRLAAAMSYGMSCRQAAERFGVSAVSALRWVEAVNTIGTVEAKPQGGDTCSHRMEAFSGVVLAAVATQKDIRSSRHRAWFASQPDLDPQSLVFIDETGASSKTARLRGSAFKGGGHQCAQ